MVEKEALPNEAGMEGEEALPDEARLVEREALSDKAWMIEGKGQVVEEKTIPDEGFVI